MLPPAIETAPPATVAASAVELSFADAARDLATAPPEVASAVADLAAAQREALAATEPLAEIDSHLIEQAVADLRAELRQYRADISAIDAKLRVCAAAPDETALRSCVERFREVNDQYLEHRGARLERLDESAAGILASPLTHELAAAVGRQDAVVAAAQADLAQFGQEVDLATQCVKLLSETHQISASADRFDTALNQTLAEIVRPQPADPPAMLPPLTHIHEQLRLLLAKHWSAGAATSGPIGVTLINPDQLGPLNAQFGLRAVDRALDELERIVDAAFTPPLKAVLTADRGYLLLLPGLTAREALAVAERCRQQMDTTWFEHAGARFRVTLSCSP